MKGYIKIETTTRNDREGLRVDTEVKDVLPLDKLQIIYCVCIALAIEPAELKLLAAILEADFLKEIAEVEVLHDGSGTLKKEDAARASRAVELLKILLK